MDETQRVTEILHRLTNAYPTAHIALNYSNPLELLIAVILSAQCTDIKVNEVTATLFEKYKTLEDYVQADPIEFEQDIKPTGFYHAKAKNVLATVKRIKENFGGQVPKTMAELITLAGVARKTANIVAGNAYGVVEGIAVDTHVSRVTQRLRLVDLAIIGGKQERTFTKSSPAGGGKSMVDFKKDADAVKIENQLMDAIPREEWLFFTYKIIDHGRAICKAPKPDCERCMLRDLCPASRV